VQRAVGLADREPDGNPPLAVAVDEANKIYVVGSGDDGPIGSGLPGSITAIDRVTNSTMTVTDPNAHGPFSMAVNPSEPGDAV
jgi:DNA-binding beta-propeller fold protein YncE